VIELNASKSGSFATDFGLTLLVAGLVLIVAAVLEPYTSNKTLTDIGYMLIGLSIQLLGLALVIIGKK
jgi:hypothetical protein